jgi:hypothetical protein
MCKYCIGLTVEETSEFHEGEYEQQEAYFERLAADISPKEVNEEYQNRLSDDLDFGDYEFRDYDDDDD